MMKVLWSEQMIVNLLPHKLLLLAQGFAGLAGNVAWAQSYVNATVDGQLAPGVYGRIQIGSVGLSSVDLCRARHHSTAAGSGSPLSYLHVRAARACEELGQTLWALQRLWSAGVLREKSLETVRRSVAVTTPDPHGDDRRHGRIDDRHPLVAMAGGMGNHRTDGWKGLGRAPFLFQQITGWAAALRTFHRNKPDPSRP